jgi:hypothetical protein
MEHENPSSLSCTPAMVGGGVVSYVSMSVLIAEELLGHLQYRQQMLCMDENLSP